MTSRPKKFIKDILASNQRADRLYCSTDESEGRYQGRMLYDGRSLVDRMKNAYKKRKREQKINALKNSDTLWSGLQ